VLYGTLFFKFSTIFALITAKNTAISARVDFFFGILYHSFQYSLYTVVAILSNTLHSAFFVVCQLGVCKALLLEFVYQRLCGYFLLNSELKAQIIQNFCHR
jgi:hypothetical protein